MMKSNQNSGKHEQNLKASLQFFQGVNTHKISKPWNWNYRANKNRNTSP